MILSNRALLWACTAASLAILIGLVIGGLINNANGTRFNEDGSVATAVCTPTGEATYLAQGETPGDGIMRAVIALRDDYRLLPGGKGSINLENVGEAERTLLKNAGDANGSLHPGQPIRVCSNQFIIESVNGKHVE